MAGRTFLTPFTANTRLAALRGSEFWQAIFNKRQFHLINCLPEQTQRLHPCASARRNGPPIRLDQVLWRCPTRRKNFCSSAASQSRSTGNLHDRKSVLVCTQRIPRRRRFADLMSCRNGRAPVRIALFRMTMRGKLTCWMGGRSMGEAIRSIDVTQVQVGSQVAIPGEYQRHTRRCRLTTVRFVSCLDRFKADERLVKDIGIRPGFSLETCL